MERQEGHTFNTEERSVKTRVFLFSNPRNISKYNFNHLISNAFTQVHEAKRRKSRKSNSAVDSRIPFLHKKQVNGKKKKMEKCELKKYFFFVIA